MVFLTRVSRWAKKNEVRDEASKCEEPLDSYEDLSWKILRHSEVFGFELF